MLSFAPLQLAENFLLSEPRYFRSLFLQFKRETPETTKHRLNCINVQLAISNICQNLDDYL